MTPRPSARAGRPAIRRWRSPRGAPRRRAAGDEADDLVAGDRGAAAGELDPDVVRALHQDAGVAGGPGLAAARELLAGCPGRWPRPGPRSRPPRRRAGAAGGATTCCAETWPSPIAAYRALMSAWRRSWATVARRLGGHQALQRQALLAHGLGELVLALLDRLLAALLGEPLADLVAGARGRRRSPASRGSGPAFGALEVKISTTSPLSSLLSSGTRRPLTRAPMRVVADLGVDRVGEVDRGRARRQRDHHRPWA